MPIRTWWSIFVGAVIGGGTGIWLAVLTMDPVPDALYLGTYLGLIGSVTGAYVALGPARAYRSWHPVAVSLFGAISGAMVGCLAVLLVHTCLIVIGFSVYAVENVLGTPTERQCSDAFIELGLVGALLSAPLAGACGFGTGAIVSLFPRGDGGIA